MNLPATIEAKMVRTKAYFPYRIVWAVYIDGAWEIWAKATRHQLNKHIRAGHPVALFD
jgi:hypothetical protein